MRTLILTQRQVLPGTNNTVLEYNFPGGGIDIKQGTTIALSSITMYYSTPNISVAYNNNSFVYTWINGNTYNVPIVDGFYEISNLNDYLHQTMLNNKHYLEEISTGKFVWFLTMAVNTSTYKIDVVSYPMNSTLYAPANYTNPDPSNWTVPATNQNPQLNVLSNGFRDIIGFSAGTYPTSNTIAVTTTRSSTAIPQVSPLSSYLLKCSLVNNNYSIPNSLIYSFPPAGNFGAQFVVAPNQMSFIDCQVGFYNNLVVTITDQNDRGVVLLDPNMNILLCIDEDSHKYEMK
jgi:hypothetical protein